ncbi:MAG TPA: PEP-CTERM sorting domain-containing protein [Oxalicibacterium sp.]|jgi:hypothetical protein|nr:PEP-CTERM sorting domain-containing protein [Oxalicibacterium sp.]
MKIRYVLVLLFLGITLNASANNGDKHNNNSWSIPSSHDALHDIIGSHGGSIGDFFGLDNDKAKHDLGWVFGNLKDLVGDLKDNWRWEKSPYCDWPPIVSSVPEPETYAMFLAGLGMIGWMARRKKQVSR